MYIYLERRAPLLGKSNCVLCLMGSSKPAEEADVSTMNSEIVLLPDSLPLSVQQLHVRTRRSVIAIVQPHSSRNALRRTFKIRRFIPFSFSKMVLTTLSPAYTIEVHVQCMLWEYRNDARVLGGDHRQLVDELHEKFFAETGKYFPDVTDSRLRELIDSQLFAWCSEGSTTALLYDILRSRPDTGECAVALVILQELLSRPIGIIELDEDERLDLKTEVLEFVYRHDTLGYGYSPDDVRQCIRGILNELAEPSDDGGEPSSVPAGGIDPLTPAGSFGWKIFQHLLPLAAEYAVAGEGSEQPLKDWIPRHGEIKLFGLLKKCSDPNIWEHCVEGDKAFDRDFLFRLPSVDNDSRAGWYLITLWDDTDTDWWRKYIGQTNDLRKRWRSHQTSAKNPKVNEFLYTHWRGGKDVPDNRVLPCRGKFVPIAWEESGFVDKLDKQNFLNLVELFFMLIFQTLRPETLTSFLPNDVEVREPHRGLNLSVPLGDRHNMRAITLLWNGDAAARAHAAKVVTKNLATAQVALKAERHKSLAIARRKSSPLHKDGIIRNADPDLGDPTTVAVKCTKCGTVVEDQAPTFVVSSGEYVARGQQCPTCPPTESKAKAGYKSGHTVFVPVSDGMSWTSQNALAKRRRSAAKKAKVGHENSVGVGPSNPA